MHVFVCFLVFLTVLFVPIKAGQTELKHYTQTHGFKENFYISASPYAQMW